MGDYNKSVVNGRDGLPFVSVVVPVLNDPERLQVCLQALEKQTYPGELYEVIVVDNGSCESVEPVVDRFTQARHCNEQRRSSYAARNRGVSLAKGAVIAFTDSDCIPASDWIERGVAGLLHTPNCGIVGGKVKLLFKNRDVPTAVEFFDSISFFQQQKNINDTKFSVTANLFTFKKVFDRVGLFNDTLKSGGDVEWGRRVSSCGYNLSYADDTVVSHPARSSLLQLYKKVVRVTGGLHERQKQNRSLFMTVIDILTSDVLPPVRRILHACSDEGLHGGKQKIKVIFIILILKYVSLWEKIRLLLGGKPARS